MARYYKRRFRARKKAVSRSYRRYRRMRRDRRRRRRRYRRRISKPEVKWVQSEGGGQFGTHRVNTENPMEDDIMFPIGIAKGIGADVTDWNPAIHGIPRGTGPSSRVGNMIRPIKLRIFGTFNINCPAESQGSNAASLRCLVLQTKWQPQAIEGMYSYPGEPAHHPWNPVVDQVTGYIDWRTNKKLFFRSLAKEVTINGTPLTGCAAKNFALYQELAKQPFRPGFSRMYRVLYDHVFTIGSCSGLSHVVNFRIKTRCPKPMVWVPTNTSLPDTSQVVPWPYGGIWILWFFIPHQIEGFESSYGDLRSPYTLGYTWQMYYVDP